MQLLWKEEPFGEGLQSEEERCKPKIWETQSKLQSDTVGGPGRVNEDDEDYMVLKAEENNEKVKPFLMEVFIIGNRFKTMIGNGSPVTIFALDEVKTIMKRDKLQVREVIKGERYLDFNGKPLQLLVYVFCELQMNDSYIKKARF